MKTLFLSIALISSQLVHAQSEDFFNLTDQFLSNYVEEGKVDYLAIKSDAASLTKLYELISTVDLKDQSEAYEKAFYINAYNLLVIKQVVDMYPLKSPLENGKFFSGIKHTVAGKKLTLDGVEKGTLLKKYPDARIHFAVVCAAVGCPPIHSRAFTPDNVEELLEERTIMAMNNTYFTRVQAGKIELSQIFNWYNGDFTSKGTNLVDYVNQYRTEKVQPDSKVSFYEYDWNLNIK